VVGSRGGIIHQVRVVERADERSFATQDNRLNGCTSGVYLGMQRREDLRRFSRWASKGFFFKNCVKNCVVFLSSSWDEMSFPMNPKQSWSTIHKQNVIDCWLWFFFRDFVNLHNRVKKTDGWLQILCRSTWVAIVWKWSKATSHAKLLQSV